MSGVVIRIRIVVALFLYLFCALAQSGQPLNVGLSVWSGYPESVKGFKAGLAAEGFVEGDNIEFLLRNSGADKSVQHQIAREFKRRKVDLVYSLTTPGTVIVKSILPSTTPIVFSIVTYPADSGLIESFEYSGNNLVGTSNFVPLRHYINLLKRILPEAKKVAIFHRLGEPNSTLQTVNLKRLFRRQGVVVVDAAVKDIAELKQRAQMLASVVDAYITTTDTLIQNGGELSLIEIAKKHRIPILSSNKQGILAGASFGPVADFYTLGEMSGHMAAKILKKQSEPKKMQSKLQQAPTVLLNLKNLEMLGISPALFEGLNIEYVH